MICNKEQGGYSMKEWVLVFGEDEFCSLRNEVTGERFTWKCEQLALERKKYVKEHKKYLRYLERCEAGSKNEKERTMKFHTTHERAIRIAHYQFHCVTRELVEVASKNGIKSITVMKPNKSDRRYKKDDFGTFKLQWFYQKLNYKAKNARVQLDYKEQEVKNERKTS